MRFTSEIYLTKKFISKEEWLVFIQTLSNYNGVLRKWKIVITNNRNQIRYFVMTKCSLPTTINHLHSFLLKRSTEIVIPKQDHTFFAFSKAGSNMIDLMNYSEIRNRGTIEYIEIHFMKLYEDKIHFKMHFYANKNGIMKKYICLFALPTSILSVDFEGNKRYFYKSSPKYLEIRKILHLLDTNSNNALLSIDTFPYLCGDFFLGHNQFSFDKHSIILGCSGSGKSKFISSIIYNIYKNEGLKQKYKIVVIDPHASLEKDIGGIGKVIDFKNHFNSIDLFMNNHDDIVVSTELLLELFQSLILDQYNPKLERVLRHSIYLLCMDGLFNFENLRRLILDLEYRNDLIKKLKYNLPIHVIDFFLSDFNELKTKSYGETISPIIGFIDEMEMIPVFHSKQNSKNLESTIHDNFLTLFSLDRTKLGDKVTKTISGFIMQQLLTIIQQQKITEHIIFIIDEVAVVENPILSRYLSEARKYNLSLVLAGQYFNQISSELKNSIFANVINYFIFRISKLDAGVLVDNFHMKIPLDDTRDMKIKLLTELQTRQCIARIDANGILLPAFKGTTLDYISIPRVKEELVPTNEDNFIQEKRLKKNFKLNMDVSLKDIFMSNSTCREDFY